MFLAVYSDNATFYLENIKGDRSVLKGVIISGYLQDRYHNQFFQITDGQIDSEFNYYDDAGDVISPRVRYANGLRNGDMVYWYSFKYSVASGADTFSKTTKGDKKTGDENVKITTTYADKVEIAATIRARKEDINKKMLDDYVLLNTDIYLESEDKKFVFESRRYEYDEKLISEHSSDRIAARELNGRANALAVADERLFITIPVDSKYSGETGIYEIEQFGVWYDEKRPGKVRTLTKFDLDSNDIEVLGLESVNDKLILILNVDNVLTFRLFDLKERMLDEVTVPEAKPDMQLYESFTNGNRFHISFGRDKETYTMDGPVLSISLENNRFELKHLIKKLDIDDEIARHHFIGSVKDKLYIITNTIEKHMPDDYEYRQLVPEHLKLLVYESENRESFLLYKGELITNADEDYEKFIRNNEPGYNLFINREFVGMDIREKQGAGSN